MTQYLTIKDWDKFQHYKDRQPPWIKLHRERLDDYDFTCLPDASKAHLMLIWLLASQLDNRIPNDPAWVAKRIGAITPVNLKLLIDKEFLVLEHAASSSLAGRSPEAEEQEQTEEDPITSDGLPDWMPRQAWEDFCAHRGKKFTDKARRIAIDKLAEWRVKGHDPCKILNQSIMNGWTGLFEPKEGANGNRNKTHSPKPNGPHANLFAGFGVADLE